MLPEHIVRCTAVAELGSWPVRMAHPYYKDSASSATAAAAQGGDMALASRGRSITHTYIQHTAAGGGLRPPQRAVRAHGVHCARSVQQTHICVCVSHWLLLWYDHSPAGALLLPYNALTPQHETAMHTMHQCVACLSTDTAMSISMSS